MTGKQLKNSILQWAIQGKLVPQDPNDEPASVLLERIRAEKVHLIKEGKIKKDKNESIIFRGEDNSYYEKFADGKVVCIDDEIPFKIPKGWEWCRLESVFELRSGQDFPPEKYNDKSLGIPYLTGASNIDGNVIIQNRWTEFPSVIAPKGCLLLVCKGSGVGKMCYMILPQAHIARQIQAIIPFTSYILIDFLRLTIECRLNEITSQANGVIPGIAREATLSFLLPIPPFKEQIRIIKIVKEIEPLVMKYEMCEQKLGHINTAILSLLQKSILQEAIQGKLVPQDASEEPASVLLQHIKEEKLKLVKEGKLKKKDVVDSFIYKGDDNKYFEKKGKDAVCIDDEIPYDIPNTWIWTRLSDVAEIYTGNSISEAEKRAKYTNVTGRFYIGTKDVGFDHKVFYDNGVAIPKLHEQDFRIAPKDSILMCIEGGSAGRKIAILSQDVCFGNKLCCFSPFVEIGKYIYYYLQSPSFINMFNENKTGIIGGVSIAKVKEILIPLPPQQEMVRIVARIDELVASIMSR